MSDLLASGAEYLSDVLKQDVSTDITYTRGNDDSEPIKATLGRRVFEGYDNNGSIIRTETRDFLVKVADLLINDVAIIPQKNDVIEVEINSVAELYVVCEINSACYERDPYGVMYRIHTKRVS